MRRGCERAPREPLERCRTGVKSVLRQTQAERGGKECYDSMVLCCSLPALGQARGVIYMYTMCKAVF